MEETSPTSKPSKKMVPIRMRTNLNVGKPTADVIFRTCLNLPSVSVMETHEVGPCLSSLIFFHRSGNFGDGFQFECLAGFGLIFFTIKPYFYTILQL